jgi:hypothetical protein
MGHPQDHRCVAQPSKREKKEEGEETQSAEIVRGLRAGRSWDLRVRLQPQERRPFEAQGKQAAAVQICPRVSGSVEIVEGSLDYVTPRAEERREEKASGHSARDDIFARRNYRS